MDGGNLRVSTRGEYIDNFTPSPTLYSRTFQYPADSSSSIWLYYQNVRGLRTKVDELYLATNDCNIDVIMLTETGLDDRINSLQLFGGSFNVFRCDRSSLNSEKRSFGGVLIATSQQHPSTMLRTSNGSNLEQVCVSVTVRGVKLLLCVVYIPPDKSNDATIIDTHIASVSELCSNSSAADIVLVCGDYNQPRIVWTKSDDGIIHTSSSQLPAASAALVDGMDFLNLCQASLQLNHLDRSLDLIFCSPEQQCTVDTCAAPLLPVDPHHPPLILSMPADRNNSTADVLVMNETRALNYRKIDLIAFSEYLLNIDWDTLFSVDDVDDLAGSFCETLCQWLSSNLPLVKKPASPPWATPHLRALKRVRNACQRKHRSRRTNETKNKFKRASADYRRLNSSLYKHYVMRVQIDLRRNPKHFWKFVNSKRKCSAIPSNVCLDGIVAVSDVDSCELFAKFFASVFADNTASVLDAEAASEGVPLNMLDLSTFEITAEMIIAAANRLKSSYSPGPDGIPAVVFARCARALANPLCRIFNASFEQGKFPGIWKESYMFPVFKKGDRQNVKNYRGITNLSAASKLFEIIVSSVVLSQAKSYISTDQHGFMPGRSVNTNLLNFTSTCITHMEQKAQVDVIYTDLKSAFDRIDHRILLCKLSRLGASPQFIKWLSSYLCGRSLRVRLNSSISTPFSNKSGVPQGSNLGPLLFTLFFNDVALLLGIGCKLVYADDLKLYLVVQSIEDCRRLQRLLDIFADWCRKNWFIISITKCHVMSFHRTTSPILFNYAIDDQMLERVNSVNDLGVVLDHKLNFNQNRSTIISRATRQLGFIAKIGRDFKSPYCLKALYCSLVRPLVENASLIWSPHQLVWSLRIERVQKRFIRLALRDLPWRDPLNLPPYPERCRLIGLDTLERRRKIQQAVFVAKLLNGEIDSPKILSLLNFRAPQRSLRSAGLLQLQSHRTVFGFNEPLTACVRAFTLVEELFEFGESSHKFMQKVTSSRLL